MCKECGRQICPPSCPEFDHKLAGMGGAVAFCALCGEAIYSGETYYRRGGVALCPSCGDYARLDELGWVCGTREVLLLCGFEKMS